MITDPADKKGPGMNNVKKTGTAGKKPAEPDMVHHRYPARVAGCPPPLTRWKVPGGGEVSACQTDR